MSAPLQRRGATLRVVLSRPDAQVLIAALALAALTLVASRLHAPLQIAVCLYIALVVALSFLGHRPIAIVASVAAALCLDYYFAEPRFSLAILNPFDALSIVLFLAIAISITALVARQRHMGEIEAANARLEEQIAARKRTDTMLQQAQEFARVNRIMLMGQMTASIAHEINQPLTGIISNAGTSLRYLNAAEPDVESTRQYLELVVRDGRRAADIISRVRGLTRRAAPAKSPLDLNETITEVITFAQGQLDRHRIQLRLALAPDLPRVPADRVQLQQVILNLVVNAIEVMSSMDQCDAMLAITSGLVDADRAFIDVRDCGPGLKEGDAERLFTAFYTTKPGGMGMGLAISRLIVEGHGGELTAFNNEPSGATFRLTLPLTDVES